MRIAMGIIKEIISTSVCGKRSRGRVNGRITLFFSISTPFFSPSLDVLIFWAISASNVLKDVLKGRDQTSQNKIEKI